MKNAWLQKKKIKLHNALLVELMGTMTDDTTLGELLNFLPKKQKDYLLGFRIFGVESEEEEQIFVLSIEHSHN